MWQLSQRSSSGCLHTSPWDMHAYDEGLIVMDLESVNPIRAEACVASAPSLMLLILFSGLMSNA